MGAAAVRHWRAPLSLWQVIPRLPTALDKIAAVAACCGGGGGRGGRAAGRIGVCRHVRVEEKGDDRVCALACAHAWCGTKKCFITISFSCSDAKIRGRAQDARPHMDGDHTTTDYQSHAWHRPKGCLGACRACLPSQQRIAGVLATPRPIALRETEASPATWHDPRGCRCRVFAKASVEEMARARVGASMYIIRGHRARGRVQRRALRGARA